jgi:hypothetical protein
MFGVPVREGDLYNVPINSKPIGVRLRVDASASIVPDFTYQSRFAALQKQVLTELTKEKSLFRVTPSLDSLEAITPNWGFIRLASSKDQISPYTLLEMQNVEDRLPCIADMQLVGLTISRSRIAPRFRVLYVGAAPPEQTVIDFDWAASDGEECIEVSDVPAADGTIRLVDHAREKAAAKAVVRAAFMEASAARARADELADKFLETYDLSDDESAFSEWEGAGTVECEN